VMTILLEANVDVVTNFVEHLASQTLSNDNVVDKFICLSNWCL
jgi:hypothetical protein